MDELRRELDDLRRDLREAEERFRDFFDRTADLIVTIDADGRLLHGNQTLFDTLHVERDAAVKMPLTSFLAPEVRDDFRVAVGEMFAAGEVTRVETVFVTAGGTRVYVEGSLQPKMIDGRAVLARGMFRDIGDRVTFEAELSRARDAALEAARLKTVFLTNVSHEIRTPMNGIVGMIDLLTSTQLTEEQRDYALQARASAEQLLSIVNNVLYVSNIEAGGLASANADFDLFRLLKRIVEVMEIAALGKDIDVVFSFDEQIPPVLRGNQRKLRQVVSNLMENAVKFTERGVVTLEVRIEAETEKHRVLRFEVRDTGIGIGDEDRLLLFEKFSQVEATSTRRFSGVGLGLATARHLVETMGGLMDVESEPGAGSTFWFTLSFAKSTADRPIASSDLSLGGVRVLLVDDALTSRRIVRHYLETSWQMRVDAAENGEAAMAMLRRATAAGDPYRVVLFDHVGRMGELAFARAVNADAGVATARLIFMASGSLDVDEAAMREAGIGAYVMKPVGQAELFDALTVALARDALVAPRSVLAPEPKPANIALPVPPELCSSIRVLLVEDNFLNMKLTMTQLQKLGYRADSVSNGKEAVDAVARTDYDVILMDCQMPIMDGYEATQKIRRRDGTTRRRRIIAMTANALEGDREKCLAAGMDDYLSKPTRQGDLEVAMARYFAA